MRRAFNEQYRDNHWGGSGRGSTPENTAEYRRFLERFIHERNVRSVVDLGCGDWMFSRYVDWQGANYLGIDVVPSVIKTNRQRFPAYRFECRDLVTSSLPPADLVLVKHVLQHWPTRIIKELLPRLAVFRYALITNDYRPSPDLNSDVAMAGYRPLDLRLAPFHLPARDVLLYTTDHTPSLVLLME
jgi:SAM-dependent methyltransferase